MNGGENNARCVGIGSDVENAYPSRYFVINEPSSERFRGLSVAAMRESSRGSAMKLN